MVHLSHSLLLILFLTGFFAGTVDAIAGGGGLISLPMLLGIGVPPHLALGTNKFQGSIGTFVASCSYYQAGLFTFKTIYKGLVFGFVGAVLGAISGQVVSSHILKQIIPILLLAIFIYTLVFPRLGNEDRQARCNEYYFYMLAGFSLGFYDGFFGPGTGSFWLFLLVCFLGYNLQKATAYTKIFNLKSNLIATACFAIGQNIDYKIALCMAAGQLLGGRIGAHFAIKKGPAIIRPIFITVVSATILTLFYQNYVTTKQISLPLFQLMLVTGLLTLGTFLWFSKVSNNKDKLKIPLAD